jgi:hypothetical protein
MVTVQVMWTLTTNATIDDADADVEQKEELAEEEEEEADRHVNDNVPVVDAVAVAAVIADDECSR